MTNVSCLVTIISCSIMTNNSCKTMTCFGCGWLVLAVIMTGVSCYLWLIIADENWLLLAVVVTLIIDLDD
jgi:hypothetical protein